MSAVPIHRRLTYQDYLRLPSEGVRYELIDGQLWAMAGARLIHQRTVGDVFAQLHSQLRGNRCTPLVAPFDVRLADQGEAEGDESHVLQPDILITCNPERLREQSMVGAPDVVIEVQSPSNRGRDLVFKRHIYERAGVPEYWVFDPDSRVLHRFLLADGAYRVDISAGKGVVAFAHIEASIDFDAIVKPDDWVDDDDA